MHREALPVDWKWSGGSSGGSGVVGRPSQTAGSGCEWSTGPSGGLGVVKRPYQRARIVQEALLEGQE